MRKLAILVVTILALLAMALPAMAGGCAGCAAKCGEAAKADCAPAGGFSFYPWPFDGAKKGDPAPAQKPCPPQATDTAGGSIVASETVVVLNTVQGDIAIRFFPETAPEHVRNFIWHAQNTYAGCTFHRVIPGFMIQGGDPNTKNDDPNDDGMGGHSYKGEELMLEAEFNERSHVRGILSMARAQDPNSAGSQFFICHGDAPFLDNKYTVFGEVIDGIEVVDAIVNVNRDKRDRPLENQTINGAKVEDWSREQVAKTLQAMIEGDPAAGTR